MLTLKLFNSVLAKECDEKPYVSEDGYIIPSNAIWAKDRIIDFYKKEKLSGNDLNKTFHKSWEKIKNSTQFELFLHQIVHYISTYGSNFQDEIYIPNEVLELPEIKLKYVVINAYTKEQLIEKCLYLLKSGIALKEETINDLISLLGDEFHYEFTGKEGIRNKEAIIKIADLYGILPSDTMEFFRYILYRTIDNSLLIKNVTTIEAIKQSNYNPYAQFNKFGLEKLAEIFNRFKPLFLAYKTKCPSTINRISKLSKKHHKPLTVNPLNTVTSEILLEQDFHWMDNATIYSLFKAMSACYSRTRGQDAFIYRIRNGKSWTTETDTNKEEVCKKNFIIIAKYLKERFPLKGVKIKLPENVLYALPTSEKMFVGNIPTGTRFYGERLAIGIYWKDSWGANDLDLSGVNIEGKVGWNAAYNRNNLYYSGDITSAPNGAVEYLYADYNMVNNTLVKCNVYSGQDDAGYKIIVGCGDNIDKKYMMNPEKLFAEIRCNAIQKQMILGMLIPQKNKQCFVLLNFGAGHTRVSGNSKVSETATRALYQQWNNPLSFNKIIKFLGAEIVYDDDFDYDFSLDALEKDFFIKLFNETK